MLAYVKSKSQYSTHSFVLAIIIIARTFRSSESYFHMLLHKFVRRASQWSLEAHINLDANHVSIGVN